MTAAALRRVTGARIDGWSAAGIAVALLVAGPLLTLPASLLDPRAGEWWDLTSSILPAALATTAVLVAGVGIGTLVVGGGLAVLVSFYDFPGRRWIDWALVLPLAMPAYVLAFVLLGALDFASPLQQGLRALFGPGLELPSLRSPGGAVFVLTLALYPYVYLLGRAAFLGQSQHSLDVARSLGATRIGAILRVAVPMARPALAAGVALALMEALADFGSVQLLGVRTFTVAIYQLWFNAFDRLAATQLASGLLVLALLLLALERWMRGRARFQQSLARSAPVAPIRLRGARAALATATPLAVLAIAFAGPLVQLAAWTLSSFQKGLIRSEMLEWARNSVLLGAMTAAIAAATAMLLVYGLRVAPTLLSTLAARLASIGYGLPGSVVAVAVIVPLGFLDRQLAALGGLLGVVTGPLLTGTALGLIFAYVVRFLALGFQTLEAQMARLSPTLDRAAQSLGADRAELLWRVHLPLMRPAILTACLLVFVETIKELPATVLLRPFGLDTLAIGVWQASTESLWETAGPPALAIVAAGLVPVVVAVRLLDRGPHRYTGGSRYPTV